MIRWLRLAATATVILTMIGLGVIAGLFLVANSGWVPVEIHPWLDGVFAERRYEIRLPALIAGWLANALLLATLLVGSMYYVYRRRQYESLVNRLERELAALRNLPFVEPAPLEDLPESADAAPHASGFAPGRLPADEDDDDELEAR